MSPAQGVPVSHTAVFQGADLLASTCAPRESGEPVQRCKQNSQPAAWPGLQGAPNMMPTAANARLNVAAQPVFCGPRRAPHLVLFSFSARQIPHSGGALGQHRAQPADQHVTWGRPSAGSSHARQRITFAAWAFSLSSRSLSWVQARMDRLRAGPTGASSTPAALGESILKKAMVPWLAAHALSRDG